MCSNYRRVTHENHIYAYTISSRLVDSSALKINFKQNFEKGLR